MFYQQVAAARRIAEQILNLAQRFGVYLATFGHGACPPGAAARMRQTDDWRFCARHISRPGRTEDIVTPERFLPKSVPIIGIGFQECGAIPAGGFSLEDRLCWSRFHEQDTAFLPDAHADAARDSPDGRLSRQAVRNPVHLPRR